LSSQEWHNGFTLKEEAPVQTSSYALVTLEVPSIPAKTSLSVGDVAELLV
jgi:hypothetical protein